MIASIVLPALFVFSGLFALTAIVHAWRTYGAQLHAIRAQLAVLDGTRDLTVQLALTETRIFTPVARRSSVRPLSLVRKPRQPSQRAVA